MSRVLKRISESPRQLAQIPKFDVLAYEQQSAQDECGASAESIDREGLVREAEAHSRQLVAQGEAERDAILQQAHAEAERIRQQAYDTGYQEGFVQGEESARIEGQAEYEKLIQIAQGIVEDTKQRWEEVVLSLHTVVSAVVDRAVKTLLQRELESAPADIDAMVKQLLEYVVEGARVRVLVNPMDYEASAHQFGQWLSDGYGEWHISVVPDQSLSQGGCVLETAHGQVDARMETRIELVKRALAQVIERGIADELNQ